MSQLHRLISAFRGSEQADSLFKTIEVSPALIRPEKSESFESGSVTRAELAQALNMVLFADLLSRVPNGAAYVADVVASGKKVVFDHGALRTVDGFCGALPSGEASITRVLRPLGYACADIYPLDRLKMTGRAWRHEDHPHDIAQFFVSELHLDRFTPEFKLVAERVLASSIDPLSARHQMLLERLLRDRSLTFDSALELLPTLVDCFARQHDVFALEDYERLLQESSEMAWISTEGHSFNHATDRVADVEAVAQLQRDLGRPVKDRVEVSASGRVRQTAFRAQLVKREFRDGGDAASSLVQREVPGSFYEFITRELVPDGPQAGQIDLRFDSANATGIFGMTQRTET